MKTWSKNLNPERINTVSLYYFMSLHQWERAQIDWSQIHVVHMFVCFTSRHLPVCLCYYVGHFCKANEMAPALGSRIQDTLPHQHVLPPHGTNIPLVGWWHADGVRSSHVPVMKSVKFQQNVFFHVHFRISSLHGKNLKLIWSLNYTLSCAKNNQQRQPVKTLTCSEANDKFPPKQMLTGYIIEPYISQLRQPWSSNEHWCSVITCGAFDISHPRRHDGNNHLTARLWAG